MLSRPNRAGKTEPETDMRQIKRIIVGHDLQVGGKMALESAVALADRCGAAVRLVHVVEPLDAYQRASHPLTSPYTLEEVTAKASASLQAIATRQELAHLQVEYEVRAGKPFVELIIAAKAWLADLIVAGGASRMEQPFLGSTSERVLRKALVPVMVAKKPLSSQAKTFLVPTDFSSCAKNAAEEAINLARCFRGRVVFLHVLYHFYTVAYAHELGVSLPISPPAPEDIDPDWKTFLDNLSLENIDWEKATEEGEAASAIVEKAEHIHADAIVMGTHGRTGLPHMLLGSVAEKVVRTATCPTLTVRPEAFQFEMP
jgi:nucleotide-binding universal stress UspA family protein